MGTTAFRSNNALGMPVMSRAFVKESDDETVPLPDRPISPHRNFVTASGKAAIEANLNRFEAAHRSAVAQNDKQALAAALREVRYWSARRSNVEVVTPPSAPDRVAFEGPVHSRLHADTSKKSWAATPYGAMTAPARVIGSIWGEGDGADHTKQNSEYQRFVPTVGRAHVMNKIGCEGQ